MAILQNPFRFKTISDSVVYSCKCYTTQEEATPIKYGEGSCFKIKNNNTICYVGLVPVLNKDQSPYSTPFNIKKNEIEYNVQTEVNNNYTITIQQTANQTIKVRCNDIEYQNTFEIPAGTSYSIIVTPDEGYTAGNPTIASTGYVNSDLIITASPATRNAVLVTIPSTEHQTITVNVYTDSSKTTLIGTYTSSFTADYGTYYEATVTPAEGYKAGTISPTSGTITGILTFTVTDAIQDTYTISVTQPNSGQNIIKINDVEGTIFAITAGSNVNISIYNKVSDNYNDDYYIDEIIVN